MGVKNKNIEDFYPLSPMQQGILYHSLAASKSGNYFEQFSWTLQGKLNITAFHRAWQHVAERHSILRSCFVWEGLKEPVQVVHRQVTLPWQNYNWQHLLPDEQQQKLEVFLESDRFSGFELTQPPLMRLTLVQLSDRFYNFTWSHHHLLLDGWSVALIFKEVLACYKAFNNGKDVYLEPIRPYRDYIVWLQQQNLSVAETFWRETLKGFTTPTSLWADRGGGKSLTPEDDYAEQKIQFSAVTTAILQSFVQQHQLTLNTLVQGAWALLLSCYSGQEDVVFGAVASGRPPTLAKVESMVGLFINTLPVRVKVSPKEFILPWLQTIQTQLLEARQYEYSPLVKVQGWSEVPKGLALFDNILVFENYPVDPSVQDRDINFEIEDFHGFERTNYPVTVTVIPGKELVFKITYNNSDRFDTITRMLGHLQTLLEGIVTNPQQRLCELSLLTESERHQLLVEWNDTEVEYPQEKCIHQLFEAQVERTPDAVAVIFEDQQLTYSELNVRANQLAHYLRSLGVKPEVLVGICVERSLEMAIGLLGILKAGGAYVPLDPRYPKERLAFMLEDASVSVLLTQEQLVGTLPFHKAKVIFLDTDWNVITQENQEVPLSQVQSDNLAYVNYTSGSTGKPKGVEVLHRGVIRLLFGIDYANLDVAKRFLQMASISFDASTFELWGALLHGARCVLFPGDIPTPNYLSDILQKHEITTLWITSALFNTVIDDTPNAFLGIQQLLIGGEALSVSHVVRAQELLPSTQIINGYGPTESTTFSCCYLIPKAIDGTIKSLSIGRPIGNTQVYLLNAQLQPVPIGVIGELYIGGAGLARGYLNRPELTTEKFIPNPFSDELGSRLYKTGDLARYLPNGEIEYIGRIDHQVKVRGFRIELLEIEAVINQHPEVRESVVIAREDSSEGKSLVAYLVQNPEYQGSGDETTKLQTEQISQRQILSGLRNFLESKLPSYMVPSAFVMLEALPLTPNGKVDRKALPAPDTGRSHLEKVFVVPENPFEEVVAGIWVQVLNREQIGIYDNFFELGGHSLLATQVISRINKAFEINLSLHRLFESPTVAELAKNIEELIKAELRQQPPTIGRVSRVKNLPLSFAQARLWLLEQLQPGSAIYNIPIAVRFVGFLNVAALEQAFAEIVYRHEALRTTFHLVNGQPFQAIASSLRVRLPVVDLRELPEAKGQALVQQLIIEESQRCFDLVQGPLIRCTLLHIHEQEYIVLFTIHHIVSDGWSMGVFVQELAALYEAFSAGKPSPLPELAIQYADFAVWQRQWLQGEVLETQLTYWKKQLGTNLRVMKLPTTRPRAEVKTNLGDTSSFLIPAKEFKALQALSRQEGVTLFMTLLAGFQVLLQRYTNQDDIVVGTDVANRNQPETELLIGFFVNLLVLRTDLAGNPSFRELLKRVRQVALGAYAHQDLPFDQLVKALQPERNLSNTPSLFQVLFVLQNAPMPPLKLPGLTLSLLEVKNEIAKFDLALFLTETERGIVGNWQYNADLFETSIITRMTDHFQTLLNSIISEPDARINSLEMLTEAEIKQQTMQKKEWEAFNRKKIIHIAPKAITLSQEKLIKISYLQLGQTFPLVIQPDTDDIDLGDWAKTNRDFIEAELLKHGAILFRNFHVNSVSVFESIAQGICPELFSEYGDLPRAVEGSKVYGSTPYPADKAILFHNESSHLHCWPLKIWFFCVQPAQQGGETPIIDCRKAYQILNPQLRERLAEKQLMYVRNYTDDLDVSWQDFFHTHDKSVVENYCRQARVDCEWYDHNSLITRQIRPAIAVHPKTSDRVFFNQIQLHHIAYLDVEVRASLLSLFGQQRLPRNVYYGDGTSIEDSVIAEINQVYHQAKTSFSWQQGDILMLDNMLAAHGRYPYIGQRKIVVAMGEMICS